MKIRNWFKGKRETRVIARAPMEEKEIAAALRAGRESVTLEAVYSVIDLEIVELTAELASPTSRKDPAVMNGLSGSVEALAQLRQSLWERAERVE